MTPLRQALSEADEALTGTLLARMQDVEAARATVRLKKAAQDLLAALDASATTARETLPEHFCVRCHHRWDSGPNVGLHEYCGDCHRAVQAALPSTAPPAPPATPDDYERGFQAGWNHSLHLLGPQQDVAPRRAETPTNRPPADAKEWTCDECGNDLLWCKHGRKAAALPLPSPALPEGPRDIAETIREGMGYADASDLADAVLEGPRDAAPAPAPELFAAGWRSGYNDGFIHCCEMNEKQRPIKVPSVQDAWQRHNLPEPEVITRPVSADGAPGGE